MRTNSRTTRWSGLEVPASPSPAKIEVVERRDDPAGRQPLDRLRDQAIYLRRSETVAERDSASAHVARSELSISSISAGKPAKSPSRFARRPRPPRRTPPAAPSAPHPAGRALRATPRRPQPIGAVPHPSRRAAPRRPRPPRRTVPAAGAESHAARYAVARRTSAAGAVRPAT